MKVEIMKIEIKNKTLVIYTQAMITASKIAECIVHQLGMPHITGIVRLSKILDYIRETESLDLPKGSVYGYGFSIPGDIVLSIDQHHDKYTIFGKLYRLMVSPVSIVDNKEFCKGVKECVSDPDVVETLKKIDGTFGHERIARDSLQDGRGDPEVTEMLKKINGTFEKGRRVLFNETFDHDWRPIASDGNTNTTDECPCISKSTNDRDAALEALAKLDSWESAVCGELIARIVSDAVRDRMRDRRRSEDDRCTNCPGRSRKSESGGHEAGCRCCSEPGRQSGVSE